MGRFRRRTWALVAWTSAAIAVGIVARLTFAAPKPSLCRGDNSGLCFDFNLRFLWYVLIGLVWLLGLGLMWSIGWLGPALRERHRRKLLASGGKQV